MVPDVRRWRRWTWLVIAWTAAMVAMALGADNNPRRDLRRPGGPGLRRVLGRRLAGTFLGWVIVAWAWLGGFLFLTVARSARRPPRRLCPPYGHPVDMGVATCRVCGYEFRAGD